MNEMNVEGGADSSSRTIRRFPRDGQRLISTPLSNFALKNVHWLWSTRIPKGKLTVIMGDAGSGKSLLMAFIASRLTTGRRLPRQKKAGSPCPVIMVSFEDDPGDTLRPRIEAMEGDSSRIRIIYRAYKKGKKRVPFEIPKDLLRLKNEIRALGAKLVTIDPLLGAWSARLNSWKDQHTRKVLDGLADVAERTGAAICAVVHPNKATGLKALLRASGSQQFVNVPRSVLVLGHDPEDRNTSVLTGVKPNVGILPVPLAFRIEKVILKAEGKKFKTARLVYARTSAYTADELMDPDTSPRGRAKTKLRKILASGPKPATTVVKLMAKEGISERTYRRAKKELDVKSIREAGIAGKGSWKQVLADKD